MAGSVNKVILVGNLGADPEIRRTQTGKPIVNMRLATTESWRDKTSGERRERTEWHKIVVFSEGLAKVAENYLRKGAKIYIEGQLQTRKWVDDKNVERYTTEIVLQGFNSTLTMLDSRADRISADNGPRDSFSKSEPNFSSSATEDLDDEIPF